MKPSGAGSVMAAHAPAEVEGDDARTAMMRRLELFPTPPCAARAGAEIVWQLDPPPGGVMGPPDPAAPATHGERSGWWYAWEPACGLGHMAHGLAPYFASVHATDIHDWGWEGRHGPTLDFLDPAADVVDQADWIFFNAPFSKAAEFVEAGLRRARRGVACLARTSFLESAGRYELFFGRRPVTAIAPFFERVPMVLGRWDPRASTATAYAWFIWMQPAALADAARRTRRLFGAEPIVMAIPPGTRARLTLPRDARDWGARPDGPDLFSGGSGDD